MAASNVCTAGAALLFILRGVPSLHIRELEIGHHFLLPSVFPPTLQQEVVGIPRVVLELAEMLNPGSGFGRV